MDLLNCKIKPIYFKYLAAASGSAVIGAFFGMVDAMVVGKYHGPIGNAALAVFSPFWSIIFCFGFLAGIGDSVLFANHRGKKDEQTAQEYFTLSIENTKKDTTNAKTFVMPLTVISYNWHMPSQAEENRYNAWRGINLRRH